jgi:hypothetical protein
MGVFNGKTTYDPDWVAACTFLDRIEARATHDLVEAVEQALHACRKYKHQCQLVKCYTPDCFLTLVLKNMRDGRDQSSEALRTAAQWLRHERDIDALFTWLHENSGIMYKEMAGVANPWS